MANRSAPPALHHTLSHFLQEEWLPAVAAAAPLHLGQLPHLHRRLRRADPRPDQAQALTPVQLNHLYAHLLERGRRKTINGGRTGLAPKDRPQRARDVAQRLHDAMLGLSGPQRRRGGRPTGRPLPEQKVWSPQELGAFLDHVRDDRLYALWLLVATTGMRRGEFAGRAGRHRLRPRHRLSHHSPRGRRPPGPRLGPQDRAFGAASPSTPSRCVHRIHRKLQAEDRQTVGRRYRDHGYVFTWPDGRPLHPENIASWFEQHTRAAGLRIADVRHSYATAALKAGISAKVISERLGHASVAFTLQTYSHVIPGMDRDAAATVADLILTSTQKGSGTVVPTPPLTKPLTTACRATHLRKEVKDERPAQ